jgi:dihydroorotase
MHVYPGLIDVHVHLREPGFEWKETVESGSRASVAGGFTTILCMPNTSPVNDHAEVSRFIRDQARATNAARVLPIGAVSRGLEGKELASLVEQREAGCVAFSDDGEPVYNAGMMRRALEWSKDLGVPVCCHEEDKTLSCGGCMNESALSLRLGLRGIPKVSEEVMVARDIELARTTGGHAHICHVSSARSVELIRRAKQDHISVTCEVAPHHLLLTEDAVSGYDTNAKMNPPLREDFECEALIAGLAEGVIDCVASDHAPHHWDSKALEFDKAAFGILGVQTTLPLLLGMVRQGLLTLQRMVETLTIGPARALSLSGFGTLRKGSRADICIVNPEARWALDRHTILSKSLNTPWLGQEMQGMAVCVMVDGRIVHRHSPGGDSGAGR